MNVLKFLRRLQVEYDAICVVLYLKLSSFTKTYQHISQAFRDQEGTRTTSATSEITALMSTQVVVETFSHGRGQGGCTGQVRVEVEPR